jgi:hypothetical protein
LLGLFSRLLGQRGAREDHLRGVAVQLVVDELADERFDFAFDDRLEQVAPLGKGGAHELVELHSRSVPLPASDRHAGARRRLAAQ